MEVNVKLIPLYFGLKAKYSSKAFENASREVILKSPIIKMPKKEFFLAVQRVNDKYKTNVDAKNLYKLGRAILFCELGKIFAEYPCLHRKQVIRLFETHACIKKNADISGAAITRPHLIDLVDLLETYTGRRLSDNSSTPLAYLERACEKGEVITIMDIADFICAKEGCKIGKILSRIARPRISRETVKSYIADCCEINVEEVDEDAPITSLTPAIGGGGARNYYQIVMWCESKFNKIVQNEFVETKTIGDLINFFAQ